MPSHRKTKRKKKEQRRNDNGTHDAPEAPARVMQEHQEKGRPHPKKCGQKENRRPKTAKKWKTDKKGPHTKDTASERYIKHIKEELADSDAVRD